jgi:lysophospholipase L1-like esterase
VPVNILCFGDSNTWGYTPLTGQRYSRDIRWTGVLQNELGPQANVVEEGLNGRTTNINEDNRLLRSGQDLLPVLIESHHPLDYLIIMLGTNDLKPQFKKKPKQIADDVGEICELALNSEYFKSPKKQLLLIAPSLLNSSAKECVNEYASGIEKSYELARHYQLTAKELGISFLNAAKIIETNDLDGVHWDSKQHRIIGEAIANKIKVISAP